MLKHKYLVSIFAALTIGLFSTAIVSAADTSIQNVAQSYAADSVLQHGLIVQLDAKDKTKITAASYKKSKDVLGVVVAANATPVSLSSDTAPQQAYVVSSGRYNVLVSTQNGSISAGDYVSVSALDGIGMKADSEVQQILGRAVNGFDGKNDAASNTTLKTSDGKTLKVAIGTVAVDITIGSNPQKTSGDSGVPQVIQKLAVSVVGKPISAPQLYASVLVLLIGAGIVASLLYSGIQTGMTAIGRNPLAKKSITRNVMQVIITGLIIFIGCLFAVYLILKI